MKLFSQRLFAFVMIFCLLSALAAAAYADKSTTVTATVGKDFQYSESISDTLKSMELRGECPGLIFGGTSQGFVIQGMPTTAGRYTLQTIVEKTAGGTDTYTVIIDVKNPDGSGASGGEQAVIVPDDGTAPKPTGDGKVAITKHPTGETVEPGGSAIFIARADNATEIIWRLVSPDTTNTYTAKEAPNYFAGLSVEGLDSDTLILHGIPYALNRWCVEAKFLGEGGPVYSNGARITVISSTPVKPEISADPKGASLKAGEKTELKVSASTVNGTLRYQWYESSTDRNSNGTAINGATFSSYTPPEKAGTTYYYVNVWSALDGNESTHVNSKTAAVTYPAPAATTPAPAAPGAQTGGNTAQTGQNTGAQTQSPNPNNSNQTNEDSAPGTQAVVTTAEPEGVPTRQRSHTPIVILILVLAAVLLAACVSLFFLKRTGDS